MNPEDKSSLLKCGTAWCAVGLGNWLDSVRMSMHITTWGEASQAAAFFLSVLLILDFIWRKAFRRYFARRWPGLFPTRARRRADFVDTTTDHGRLGD